MTGRRIGRVLTVVVWVAGAAVLSSVVAFVALSIIFSPTYMFRWAVWQEADVGDHARFPERALPAAGESFAFDEPLDPETSAAAVRSAMEASQLVDGDAEVFFDETGTQAFIVIHDDVILYEGYFGGFERESMATSFSVAKSYVSALVGIAIEEGVIRSVADPITAYLPELAVRDGRFSDITIGHLIDMTSGIRYVESGLPWGDDALTYYYDDLRALALDRAEIEGPPGERWHYVNYNPLLLGLILERATGTLVTEYLDAHIWSRIGSEFGASWSLDHEGGFEKMESGINARAIDFAKLGRLYLERGIWHGEQIVPAGWVEESTRPDFDGSSVYYPDSFYQDYGTISHEGYWWRIARPDGRYAFTAHGNHGQFVFVSPAERLIIVRNGERYGVTAFQWFEVFTMLADALGRPSAS